MKQQQAIQYLAFDVHQATVVATLRDESGKVVMRATARVCALDQSENGNWLAARRQDTVKSPMSWAAPLAGPYRPPPRGRVTLRLKCSARSTTDSHPDHRSETQSCHKR